MAGALLKKTAAGADQTPDAVNWANITTTVSGSLANANQTISGITAGIQLKVTYADGQYLLEYRKNSGSYVVLVSGDLISVVNGDTVNFRANGDGVDTVANDTVTVMNHTLADAVLDTFLVNIV